MNNPWVLALCASELFPGPVGAMVLSSVDNQPEGGMWTDNPSEFLLFNSAKEAMDCRRARGLNKAETRCTPIRLVDTLETPRYDFYLATYRGSSLLFVRHIGLGPEYTTKLEEALGFDTVEDAEAYRSVYKVKQTPHTYPRVLQLIAKVEKALSLSLVEVRDVRREHERKILETLNHQMIRLENETGLKPQGLRITFKDGIVNLVSVDLGSV